MRRTPAARRQEPSLRRLTSAFGFTMHTTLQRARANDNAAHKATHPKDHERYAQDKG